MVKNMTDAELYSEVVAHDFRMKGRKATKPNSWMTLNALAHPVDMPDEGYGPQSAGSNAHNAISDANNAISDANNAHYNGNNADCDAHRVTLYANGTTNKGARSSAILAAKFGTSSRMVEKIRTIIDYGDEEIKHSLISGELRIEEAYHRAMRLKKLAQIFNGKAPIRRPRNPSASMSEVLISIAKGCFYVPGEVGSRSLERGELYLLKKVADNFQRTGWIGTEEHKAITNCIDEAVCNS